MSPLQAARFFFRGLPGRAVKLRGGRDDSTHHIGCAQCTHALSSSPRDCQSDPATPMRLLLLRCVCPLTRALCAPFVFPVADQFVAELPRAPPRRAFPRRLAHRHNPRHDHPRLDPRLDPRPRRPSAGQRRACQRRACQRRARQRRARQRRARQRRARQRCCAALGTPCGGACHVCAARLDASVWAQWRALACAPRTCSSLSACPRCARRRA